MEIYEIVKKIREEKNFSQEYVANQLGLSQSQYCRRENGKIKFSVDEIIVLSKQFDVSMSVFFNSNNNPILEKNVTTIPERIIELYEACLKEKDEVIAMLKNSKKIN